MLKLIIVCSLAGVIVGSLGLYIGAPHWLITLCCGLVGAAFGLKMRR